MLLIADRPLPRSDWTYAAFRLAFWDTRERLELAQQLSVAERSFGYLTEVPFLRNVPAQVQLDLLLETWAKHSSPDRFAATLLDESVIYAACETAAVIVRASRKRAEHVLRQGPVQLNLQLSTTSADQLQQLHLDLGNEGQFLLLSQFQDMTPDEAAPLKQQYGIPADACQCMLNALSRWHVDCDVFAYSRGLLTPTEAEQAASLLANHHNVRGMSSH